MTYEYKVGKCTGKANNSMLQTRSDEAFEKMSDSDIMRVVNFQKKDDFGIYKIKCLHAINSTKFELLEVDFEPHESKE
jgi:hypothetical protein